MTFSYRFAFVLPLIAIAVSGCGSGPRLDYRTTQNYETVTLRSAQVTARVQRLNEQAIEHIKQEQWDQAEALLKQALAADVMFGPAHNNLGRVYFAKRQLYLAAWEFQYAIRLMPHHVEPRNNLGLVFEAASQLQQAEDQYAAALDLAPQHPEVISNLVRVKVRQGDKSADLVSLLEKLVLLDDRERWNDWAHRQLIRLRASRSTPDVDPSDTR